MKLPELVLETNDGTYTRSLLASVLETRRAYVVAMRRAQHELLAGSHVHIPADAGDISLDIRWLREPKCVRRAAKKLASATVPATDATKIVRNGLRLVPAMLATVPR